MEDLFKLQENENEEKYIWRIGQLKDTGVLDMSWDRIAYNMNRELKTDEMEYLTEAAYRKPYHQAKRFYDAGVFDNMLPTSVPEAFISEKHLIKMERQKLIDERTALNKIIREQGRNESMFEIVKRAIEETEKIPFEYRGRDIVDSDKDIIIHLTDVHCGVYINSIFNRFDSNVLKIRLMNYLDEIYEIVSVYHPKNAHLIIGGDLIQGLIHINSRIEAKENVVQQIMTVTDLISSFIYELHPWFQNVNVYTTPGNHSRATENKEYTAKGEYFDLLIPFACKKDFRNIENVRFIDNVLDCGVATFNVRGHMVYASHGDKDSVNSVVYNMTKFARKAGLPLPDMCFLGHRHTNGMKTVDDVKVIESGCVSGMDNYTIDNRLVGSPEQVCVVVSEKKIIHALYDIQLDS